MKSSDVEPLMKAVGGVVKGALDKLNKRMHGMHEETNMRMDGLVSRAEKNAQQLAALHSRVAAIERKQLAQDKQ